MLNPQATTAIRELRAKVMRAAAAPMPRPFEPEIIEVVLGPDALIQDFGPFFRRAGCPVCHGSLEPAVGRPIARCSNLLQG
jgi:hypothetical protein